MSAPWRVDLGADGGPEPPRAAPALERAGLATQVWKSGASGPGLVFFAGTSPALYTFIAEASRGGAERVLAVAWTARAVGGGAGWRLVQAGASDVLAWDQSRDPGADITRRLDRWQAVDELIQSALVQRHLVGRSPAWLSALRQIVEVARFTETAILITGESGTGKELAARLVHTLDPRPQKRDLVLLDCTTVVPELSGSEFFGHERGAFTGAMAARDGAFAQAHGGTLFLDEVGELPAALQGQLLRVIQERTYKRVGGNSWQSTDFRLVCATNRDLRDEVERAAFRADLYFRVAGWSCRLPALRQRREDILPLARHFVRELWKGEGEAPVLGDEVSEHLLCREYPGNVRELRQCIARIMHHHVGDGPLTVGDVPIEERPVVQAESRDWRDESFERCIRHALAGGVGLRDIGRAAMDTAVRLAIADGAGSLRHAAQRLGVTDRALQLRRAARRQAEDTGTRYGTAG